MLYVVARSLDQCFVTEGASLPKVSKHKQLDLEIFRQKFNDDADDEPRVLRNRSVQTYLVLILITTCVSPINMPINITSCSDIIIGMLIDDTHVVTWYYSGCINAS